MISDNYSIANLRKHFGRQLKCAREAKGYTQKALAEALGMDGNTVARIERGAQGIRWANLERLVELLGQPASFYFSNEVPVEVQKVRPTRSVVHLTQVRRDQIVGEIARLALKLSDENLDGLLRDALLSLESQLSHSTDSLDDVK